MHSLEAGVTPWMAASRNRAMNDGEAADRPIAPRQSGPLSTDETIHSSAVNDIGADDPEIVK